ncbi:universal stress protein [Acaryochloris sp. IP29b_bin.148]|uniref:universal stress protein n=1 Tax=Acaryochloris sp. IP29b_bin.148 TaxID=2969218 RepID=UPI00262AE969|nr:universal stress protein [Acaryochloris sp. IP29b_bin.148]
MFNTILVALDSPEISERVMQALKSFQLDAVDKVVLTHVISTNETGEEQPADRPYSDPQVGLFRHIEEELQTYQASLPCDSSLEIVTGDPAEEIVRVANIYKADLILIGSRGLTGVTRILQRSVSSQVVSDASCSVMVVR